MHSWRVAGQKNQTKMKQNKTNHRVKYIVGLLEKYYLLTIYNTKNRALVYLFIFNSCVQLHFAQR